MDDKANNLRLQYNSSYLYEWPHLYGVVIVKVLIGWTIRPIKSKSVQGIDQSQNTEVWQRISLSLVLSASVGLVGRWLCVSASAAKLASPFLSFLRFFFPNCCFMYNAKFLRDRSTLVSKCSLSFNESVESHHSMWSEVQIFFCVIFLCFLR